MPRQDSASLQLYRLDSSSAVQRRRGLLAQPTFRLVTLPLESGWSKPEQGFRSAFKARGA